MGRHPDIDTRVKKFNRKLVKAKENYVRYLTTKDMDDLEECAEQLKIACDQAIKTAGVIAKLKGIQIIGSEYKDRFAALCNAGIISKELYESMRGGSNIWSNSQFNLNRRMRLTVNINN